MRGKAYRESKLKRIMDILIALGLLLLSSPVWLLMYLYNKSRNEPLFFKQERVGQYQVRFRMLKFETLHQGAEELPWDQLSYDFPANEREDSDPRNQSKFLRLLRKVGINEFPQLLNVLLGDMSIVGPRPLPPEYIKRVSDRFPKIYKEWSTRALLAKPGVLGISPLKTRRLPLSMFEVRARTDITYLDEASIWFDIKTMAQGFWSMVTAPFS